MKKLKSLLLVYDDGTEKRLGLNEIDARVQEALAASGLSSPLPEISKARYFLVIRWKDGWQEIMAINSDTAALLRYFVIRRIEDKGRLVLDIGSDYPELLVVDRTPMDIDNLLIVGENDVKSYGLELELEGYEGTFEAGGKKEYTKYDRDNPYFKNEFRRSPESTVDIRVAVTSVLREKELLPETLLSMDSDRRVEEYADIARIAGIRGVKRQGDVYGFIELILKQLVSNASEIG